MTDPVTTPSALIITGSVGAGHDGAADELAHRLRQIGLLVDVRDYLDALPRPLRFFLRTGYTGTVERIPFVFQWLFWAIENLRPMQAAMSALCRLGDDAVARWARARPYAVVVSTYPLAGQSLGNLRESGRCTVPVVSYLTDPAPHRYWVHPAVDHHLTVTEQTAQQGQADYGIAMTVAGPLVPARFRSVSPSRTAALRADLGLSPDRLVALVGGGSLGLGAIEEVVRLVLRAGLVPLVLCGRNDALRRRLSVEPAVVALGWRTDVHELMHVADVLVHNAGGLTFTEAYVAGLPAVSYRCIPGHGRINAAALEDAGLAPWAHSPGQFLTAVRSQAVRDRVVHRYDDPATVILGLVGATVQPLVEAA